MSRPLSFSLYFLPFESFFLCSSPTVSFFSFSSVFFLLPPASLYLCMLTRTHSSSHIVTVFKYAMSASIIQMIAVLLCVACWVSAHRQKEGRKKRKTDSDRKVEGREKRVGHKDKGDRKICQMWSLFPNLRTPAAVLLVELGVKLQRLLLVWRVLILDGCNVDVDLCSVKRNSAPRNYSFFN